MSAKWDKDRVEHYFKLYGDPRNRKGSQSGLCEDIAKLIDGDSVVDFGNGMGHLIPYIGERKYLGIDSSEEMSGVASTLFPAREFKIADITKPGLRDSLGINAFKGADFKFDTATCVSVFIHFSHDEMIEALKNMASMAKTLTFSMETNGDSEVIRKDGLRIRNESVENILTDLTILGPHIVSWQHQSFTYEMLQTFTPLKNIPLKTSIDVIARTTIFKVIPQ